MNYSYSRHGEEAAIVAYPETSGGVVVCQRRRASGRDWGAVNLVGTLAMWWRDDEVVNHWHVTATCTGPAAAPRGLALGPPAY
jgi:hypothetical protein